MANNEGKGWFAILLGKQIDFRTVIPPYIRRAIIFAHGTFSAELIFNILKYRVLMNYQDGAAKPPELRNYWSVLLKYRTGEIDFSTIKAETAVAFPNDQILAFMDDLP